jgi:uncharacterized protein (DUF2164 family)
LVFIDIHRAAASAENGLKAGSPPHDFFYSFPSIPLAMTPITFSKQEREAITQKIHRYFDEELKQEIGRFDAEFLLDFFTKEIGVYFYNQGLYDAQTVVNARVEELNDAILMLEKPTES